MRGLLLVVTLVFVLPGLFLTYNTFRYRWYLTQTLHAPFPAPSFLPSFIVSNPYSFPGSYRRAQLHAHTSASFDVRSKIPLPELIEIYRRHGYTFLVLTDHDRITDFTLCNSPDFLVVSGMEQTLPFPFCPLGRHLLRIGVAPAALNGKKQEVAGPAHPNWNGNLGACWYLEDILKRPDFKLLEIYNKHSPTDLDILLWHKLLIARGCSNPIWGIAVDDSDNGDSLNYGWVMVKTTTVNRESLLTALNNGAFYATSGPEVDFRVVNNTIEVSSDNEASFSFIDSRNKAVASTRGKIACYRPKGNEGFIRVEIRNRAGGTAWSQPFFLI